MPESSGSAGESGEANGFFATDGAGPGIEGGVEKSGRASSMKEKAGMAEESTKPNAPGTVGAGGWVVRRGWGSDSRDAGIAA